MLDISRQTSKRLAIVRTVGTGKLDLNFVNEGPIFQTHKWSELKSNQPFFAQIHMPEVEYNIDDRKWVGEDEHPKIATPESKFSCSKPVIDSDSSSALQHF